MEKWIEEERERRSKLKPMYESKKPKRSIEGSETFGYVKETEDMSTLHKNTLHQPEPKEETLDSHFEHINDEDFEKALNKASKSKEVARLKKEASRHLSLSPTDQRMKRLAEEDGNEAALAKGDEVIKEEKRIVGKDKRTEVMPESLNGQKLTTEQKINKEL